MNLEISDLEVFYGKIRAIKGISIRVNEGELMERVRLRL
jgi:ABC-type branched-subunit amino acid transport system ATPase component